MGEICPPPQITPMTATLPHSTCHAREHLLGYDAMYSIINLLTFRHTLAILQTVTSLKTVISSHHLHSHRPLTLKYINAQNMSVSFHLLLNTVHDFKALFHMQANRTVVSTENLKTVLIYGIIID